MDGVLNCMGHELRFPDIVRSRGSTLVDARGRRYLDLEAGVWCASLGHGHPAIRRALARQSRRVIHAGYCYNHRVVGEAAAEILGLTGHGGGACLFLNSGSEVVDLALSVAAALQPGKGFLAFKDSYLAAFGAGSGRDEARWQSLDWLCGQDPATLDYSRVGAFVFEPGSSSGLVRFPPRELVRNVAERVRAAGGLLIANEVTTGMGRTGAWFGYEHYGIRPDLVAVGKGLGGGYPVSCLSLSASCAERLGRTGFHYGQSHQNDPLGAAVALAVIRTMKRGRLVDRSRAKGEYLRAGLEALGRDHPLIAAVRGRGLMVAIELGSPPGSCLADAVNAALLAQGIILVKRPGHEVLRLDPSLTISRREIDRFLKALGRALAQLEGRPATNR